MEKNLKFVGTDSTELYKVLELIFQCLFKNSSNPGILYWGEEENKLYFSQYHSEECTNPFPTRMSEAEICGIITKWLFKFEKEKISSNGTTLRGFLIEYKEFNPQYDFYVEFKTLFYGK